MRDSGYRPAGETKKRCAPADKRDGQWIAGEVHDPRAHRLGGVAGHAGLFSTAADLAIYAPVLLDEGKHDGQGFLKAGASRPMTAPPKVGTPEGPRLPTHRLGL